MSYYLLYHEIGWLAHHFDDASDLVVLRDAGEERQS